MKEDRKQLNNSSEMVLWFGLAALAFHVYVELHTFFSALGWAHPFSDNLIGRFITNSPFLRSHYWVKLSAGVAISFYSYSNRGVKSVTLTRRQVITDIVIGVVTYGGSILLLTIPRLVEVGGITAVSVAYLVLTLVGVLYLIKGSQGLNRLINFTPGGDTFNRENETFPQEELKIENEYSINLETRYYYEGKWRLGWINIANPFRANMILGTPGSGKSYTIMNTIIRQHIEKGFSMYVYDWKFPDLTLVAFNAMRKHRKHLPAKTTFCCINFDDPRKSHRCNPLDPSYLPAIDDAYESAKIMMVNMNKSWIGKEGDFWVDSAINYTTALLWFLRTYQNGKYCTFPHLVEMMTIDYRKIFPVLMAHPDLEAYMTLFISAYNGGAMEQLEGQVGSARGGLAKLSSPNIYWVMSANDFTLDINNPKEPKILCVANNSKKKNLYGAALGLFNARILNQINIPHQHPCSVVIDELPTLYFQGLSDLIGTGRGNKIAVTLSMQDFSQAEREYGKAEAEVIRNTVGTIITGAVSGTTAKAMEERIGKNVQRKQSLNIQSEDTTHGFSTELQPMVPAAKIGQLKAGSFVGVVAGAFGQEGDLKVFNAEVVIDQKAFDREQKVKELPDFSIFAKQDGSVEEVVRQNYLRIKAETKQLIEDELVRLAADVNQVNPKPNRKNDRGN